MLLNCNCNLLGRLGHPFISRLDTKMISPRSSTGLRIEQKRYTGRRDDQCWSPVHLACAAEDPVYSPLTKCITEGRVRCPISWVLVESRRGSMVLEQ